MPFLPTTTDEMQSYGWNEADIIIVTGDAYVDHPSFGTAIVSRVLENAGYKVCILPQPQSARDISRFGKPRLAFFVNSGNIDSMVAHYTVAKRRRSEDAYSPGGKMGKRPDRAINVYCKWIKSVYPDSPIAIGGLEASLRRFAHYDYWDDAVRPSILIDSGADLLMYGMGERTVVQLADALNSGIPVNEITDILGTCYAVDVVDYMPRPCSECPSFESVSNPDDTGKREYAVACRIQQNEHDGVRGKTVIQRHGNKIVVQNPPQPALSTDEMDSTYELPYMKEYHPSYEAEGGIPGIEEVKFSLVHNRGCFGACNFCSLAYHQGRQISIRSEDSVVKEAEALTKKPDFKGYIHDVGGPTANFRAPSCKAQLKRGLCKDKKCLAPEPCPAMEVDHSEYLHLLRRLEKLPKIKKVFIRSGIRFDYLILDKNEEFFKELVEKHVSGQLKVAPEHCSDRVLAYMGKPSFSVYKRFRKKFYELSKKANKKQYLVPYLMSSHPGSTVNDAIELSLFLKEEGLRPEQVQDFYPTPGTVSTCMFYTGLDPYTMKPVYVPKTPEEKAEQRALLQYFLPQNRHIVLKALRKAGRSDLIGFGKNCLVKPDPRQNSHANSVGKSGGKVKNKHGNKKKSR